MAEPLLRVRGLSKRFDAVGSGARRGVDAVREVTFDVLRGETFGLVGESGSGKSTLSRCLLQLVPASSGTVEFDGVELTQLGRRALRPLRRRMQLVFQDPMSSLNPRMTVRTMLTEPLRVHALARGPALQARVLELLDEVGLQSDALDRYPHEFSGGQRQRLVIARALSVEPELLIADEPVSALDVSIRAQVVNLLLDLKGRRQLTYVFIAHDLKLVAHVSDRVAVMYLGRIVELGPAASVLQEPLHPYTRALLDATLGPHSLRLGAPTAAPQLPLEPGPTEPGCAYAARCPLVEARCRAERPELRQVRPGHSAACLRY